MAGTSGCRGRCLPAQSSVASFVSGRLALHSSDCHDDPRHGHQHQQAPEPPCSCRARLIPSTHVSPSRVLPSSARHYHVRRRPEAAMSELCLALFSLAASHHLTTNHQRQCPQYLPRSAHGTRRDSGHDLDCLRFDYLSRLESSTGSGTYYSWRHRKSQICWVWFDIITRASKISACFTWAGPRRTITSAQQRTQNHSLQDPPRLTHLAGISVRRHSSHTVRSI